MANLLESLYIVTEILSQTETKTIEQFQELLKVKGYDMDRNRVFNILDGLTDNGALVRINGGFIPRGAYWNIRPTQ